MPMPMPMPTCRCRDFQMARIKECRCLKNAIHQRDSKNEWLLLPACFTTKIWSVFVLALENASS